MSAPVMRRLLHTSIKKHLAVASVMCIASIFVTKAMLCDPRKAEYAEFYKTYDAEKDYQRMVKLGVFQSVKN